jgi:DNA-binding response OmpR family regulator
MRILIAEDDPVFRQILEEILVKWGYEVVVTRDGNEAWQALKSKDAPRLVILDWMMPGINGVELCRKVRKELPEPYTYIILLTSQQQDEDLVTGMEAGADDYLAKPLKVNELRVRLNAGRRIVELQNELAVRALDLEAANRDLESFSYTVANDLLKSLLSIGENAKSIQDIYSKNQDDPCRSYTHQIYEKTKKLGQLIAIMHDFFRPTRDELHRETINLSEMAGKTAENLRMAKPERRVNLKITDGIKANGDRNLLKVALDNLLDNAWKHTGTREEALIEFGVTEVDGKPAYFVRDNGIGIDMTLSDKLFKPFQKLPGTEELEGPGIGLATVERIIRRHGGKIWAEGEPGKGATFYFTL